MKAVKFLAIAVAAALLILLLPRCESPMHDGDPIAGYDKTTVVLTDEKGDFTVSQKKYGYGDEDVEVLKLENGTGEAYDVMIIAHFKLEDVVKTTKRPKKLFGIPAGYSGYVLIRPEIGYESCELHVTLSPCKGETPLSSLKFGTDLDLLVTSIRDYEKVFFPGAGVTYNMTTPFRHETEKTIYVQYSYIAFDSDGEIFMIYDKSQTFSEISNDSVEIRYGVPCEGSIDDYRLPDNLKGNLHAVVAVDYAEYYEYQDEILNRRGPA